MRSTGKNIELKAGGVTISYNDQGPDNAPVVIFIHGLALNKSMWQVQEDAFKNTYRVIAYDIRGHGGSQAGEEDFSIELFADDLVRFMDVLFIDKAIICGLSMGGYIALRAMIKYPERFNGLVLCDTQCIADTPEAREKRLKAIDDIQSNGKEGFALQNAKNIFLPDSFTSRKKDTEDAIKSAMNMDAEAICSTLLALANRDETCSRLEEIIVPTLILVGKEDKLIPPERSMLMNQKIKNSTLHVIDHAAHVSNIENTTSFNQSLLSFLFVLPKTA
jgi:3-oxoadipate enol-lactonase